MRRLQAILRDPLTHFLVAGAALFAVLSALRPAGPSVEDRILVSRDAVLRFVQYRSKAFEPGAAERLFDSLSEAEKKKLVDDFVREEALYREAKALGVAETDYVVRERMVQSAVFLAETAATTAPATDQQVAAYFKEHVDDYKIEASVSFAHVFFQGAGAERRARAKIAELNAANAPFEAATLHGERFPFHVNYVERTADYVASQFGDTTTAALFDAATPLSRWTGPYRSDYGVHAVFVSGRTSGRLPDLSEIRSRVAEDTQRKLAEDAREREISAIIERYSPSIASEVFKAPLEVPAPK